MSGLSKGSDSSPGPGFPSGSSADLEAENARLRAALAAREADLDRLQASLLQDSRIRAVADALPVLISYVDAEQRYRFNNRAYQDWFGDPNAKVIGRHMRDVLGEAAYRDLRPLVEQALAGRRVSADRRLAYRDGGVRHVHIEYVPDRRADGRVAGFYALVQDVSDSKRAEQVLRESEARFRAMADCAPAPVWVTGLAGVEFVNQAYVEFGGMSLEDVSTDTWTRIIHPDDLPGIMAQRERAWAASSAYGYEARFRRSDGEWRFMQVKLNPRLDENGTLIGYVGMAVDVTESHRAEEELRELNQSLEARVSAAIAERERAEAALRQAQKMEAVGQLTGGIAHDFNNLLTVIGGNLDMALRRIGSDGDPRLLRALGSALTGAQRAATLTQRLLAFSRRQPLAPKAIDVNSLLSGMSELLHRTLGETILVETRLASGLARIEADPHQLESAILNLAVNARDAMPDGGRLTIETGAVVLAAEEIWASDPIDPGAYVVISVSDTGIGMDGDTLRRAVEPFFTTKDVGKGTGLGLSMVYGFVRQSGGHFRIESEEGKGTRIHLYLPRLAYDLHEEEQAGSASAPRGAGEETILVCEDDDDVRAYTHELLTELGYRVLEARDGAATLHLLADRDNRIDMLFTDVVLPGGMSGAALAQEARRLRPELRILYTTGYARDAIVHDGRLDPGIDLVAKPFAFAELAARVRDVLDRN